ADTIRQAGCGLTVRLNDPEGLVDALTHLAADPDLAEQMGARGRSAFLAEFDKDVCCDFWSGLLKELVGAPGATWPRHALAFHQAAYRRNGTPAPRGAT